MALDPLQQYQTDHDLLVTLNERMSNLIEHVKNSTDTNKQAIEGHEERLRTLEKDSTDMKTSQRNWRFYLSTAIAFLSLVVAVIAIVVTR